MKTLDAVASGDAVSDKRDREVVGLAMEQSWRWAPLGSDRKELIIGDEQWPFPVPLAEIRRSVAYSMPKPASRRSLPAGSVATSWA